MGQAERIVELRSGVTLYRLSQPVRWWSPDDNKANRTMYVVVSTAVEPSAESNETETYMFPSDEDGNVLSWSELEGSLRGTTDHATVLATAGFRLMPHALV